MLWRKTVRILCLLWCLVLLPGIAVADSRKPIKIALTDDPAQAVTAHMAAAALQAAGYNSELVALAPADMAAALVAGVVHVQPEWSADDPGLAEILADGGVLDMGRRNSTDHAPEVRKVIWRGMRKPWPGAVKLFRNFSYPTADQTAMVAAIANGASIEDEIARWLEANRDRVMKWKSVSVNWMKP